MMIGLWAGCTARIRVPEVKKSAEDILSYLNISFEEVDEDLCCGAPLEVLGFIDDFKKNLNKVKRILSSEKYEYIITLCPECLYVFKRYLPHIISEKILHISDYLAKYTDILFNKAFAKSSVSVYYHEPCALVRKLQYDSTKKILEKIPGLKVVNSLLSGKYSTCCGAGGGVFIYAPDIAIEAASEKIETEIIPSSTDYLIVSCPVCYMIFKYAITLKGYNIKLVYLTQLMQKVVRGVGFEPTPAYATGYPREREGS